MIFCYVAGVNNEVKAPFSYEINEKSYLPWCVLLKSSHYWM